jgi:hypothetical protein
VSVGAEVMRPGDRDACAVRAQMHPPAASANQR